jgi:hypothetical protein
MRGIILKIRRHNLKFWLWFFLIVGMAPRLSAQFHLLTEEEKNLLDTALAETRAVLAQSPPDSVARRGQVADFEERLLISSYSVFVNRLRQRLRSTRAVWWEANRQFLAVIDYRHLFKNFSFLRSLSRFERIRKQLDNRDPFGSCGRRFLLEMAEQFYKLYPPSDTVMSAKLGIAKAYLAIKAGTGNKQLPNENITKPVADVYNNIGRFLLLQCANYLQKKVDQTPAFANASSYKGYKKSLELGGIYLNNEVSNFAKTWDNLRDGEFVYLWDRFSAEAERRLTSRKNRIQAALTSALNLSLRQSWNAGAIELYDVVSSGTVIGSFLLAKGVGRFNRIGYDAHETKGFSLDSLRYKHGAQKIYAALTGNYSTEVQRSIGFSAVKGKISNYFVDHKMHGFVYITADGAIHVENLADGFEIDEQVSIYPQNDLTDVAALWEWVERQRLSCFQTHILIDDGGKPAINPKDSPYDLRERRLLAVFPNQSIGIINFPGKYDLVEATYMVQRVFENYSPRFWPLALVNLDVGRYDVYRVFDDHGIARVTSPKDFDVSPNLLFVYR